MDEETKRAHGAASDLKRRNEALDADGLDLIFREARTYRKWRDREVSDDLLRRVFEIARLGPTSGNCCPMRVVFVKSREAKERLRPALSEGNVEQTMTAPVCAVVGYDLRFFEDMDWLAPAMNARATFEGKPERAYTNAFRNGSLQGAYLIVAARALGLDCGPMSGFNNAKVDETFFAGTEVRSNFLCNLGYGDPESLDPRAPRHAFDQACRIA